MSENSAVLQLKCVFTYFKQTHRFFSFTCLITSNIGKKPKKHLNFPEDKAIPTSKSMRPESQPVSEESLALIKKKRKLW